MSEWRIVFWIAFVIFNVTNIIYLIWASGEVQDFNNSEPPKVEEPVPEPEAPKKENRGAFTSYFSKSS